jgi:hypothetical protein
MGTAHNKLEFPSQNKIIKYNMKKRSYYKYVIKRIKF